MAQKDDWSQYEVKETPKGGSDWSKYEEAGPPNPSPTGFQNPVVQGAENFLGGVGASVYKPIAVGEKYLTGRVNPTLEQLATPPPTFGGKAGNIAGQAAQFLVPGELEEKAAAKIGKTLADAPAIVRSAAKMLPMVGSTAAVNAAQGGSPEAGAIAGATGGVLGKAAEAVAPRLAESALGVTSKGRGFGKTPGMEALEETTGYSPAAVEESSRDALDRIGGSIGKSYRDAGKAGKQVSLEPALQTIQSAWEKALGERNPDAAKAMEDLYSRLVTPLTGGKASVEMSPEELWNVKQGIGKDANWNPNLDPKWVQGMRRQVYHAIDSELDRVVPKAADLNQKYSSLKEVAKRADIEGRGAGLMQKTLGRFGARTGALFGSGMGGYYGYKEGGVPGAILGAAGGAIGPELIASPAGQMFGARNLPEAVRTGAKISLPLLREMTNSRR